MKGRPAVGRLRGKTRAGRLGIWDAWMVAAWPEHVRAGVVEVGVGDRADTAIELAGALGEAARRLWVVELHPQRCAAARPDVEAVGGRVLCADALAGPVAGAPPPEVQGGMVRCANVLRQYPVGDVPRAHRGLAAWVGPGGVVMEGSCDAGGDVGSFHVLTVSPARVERRSLVFFSSFARGFAPIQLRDWLPRDLRREVRADGVMAAHFARWTEAWARTRRGQPGGDFRRAAEAMDMATVDLSAVRPGAAACVWTPAGGVPAPRAHS